MKLKEKIVGSVTILILSIVFLMFGYFSNKDNKENFEEVFSQGEENMGTVNEGSNNKDNKVETSKTKITNGETTNTETATGEKANEIETELIIVDIKGAVNNPKEYKLKQGARIRDLIEAAGGLTDTADQNKIRFSKVLNDEDCIKIYEIGEVVEDTSDIYTAESEESSSEKSSSKINLNKASLTELQTLPGIGEVKAQSIIDYRESSGGFKTIDDLTNITGIGPKTVDKFRDMVDIK